MRARTKGARCRRLAAARARPPAPAGSAGAAGADRAGGRAASRAASCRGGAPPVRSARSAASASSPSTRSTGCPTRRSSSARSLGLALLAIAAALIVTGKRLVVTEELEEPTTRPTSIPRSRRRSCRSSRRAAAAITRRRLFALGAGRLGRARSALALLAPLASLGPVLDMDALLRHAVAARAAARRRERPAAARRRHRGGGRSTPRSPRAPTARRSAVAGGPRAAVARRRCALPAAIARLRRRRDRRLLEDLHARGLRGLALPHAAVPAGRSHARRWSARATTRRSTRRAGGTVLFGPAGRKLPMLPLAIDRRGPAAGGRATSTSPSARRGGASGSGGRRRDPPRSSASSTSAAAPRRCCARRCATCSPTTGRSCSARSRCTLHRPGADRHLPGALLQRQHPRRRLPRRRTRRCEGQHDDRGLPVGARHLDHRQGRPADPPDASLGGRRVPRRRSSCTCCACSSPAPTASRAS